MDKSKRIALQLIVVMFTVYLGYKIVGNFITHNKAFPLMNILSKVHLRAQKLENKPIPKTLVCYDAQVMTNKVIAAQPGVITFWGQPDILYKKGEIIGRIKSADNINYESALYNYINQQENVEMLAKHYNIDLSQPTNNKIMHEALQKYVEAARVYSQACASTIVASEDCYTGLYPPFGTGSSVKHGEEIAYVVNANKKKEITCSASLGHDIQVGNKAYFAYQTLDKEVIHIPAIITSVGNAYTFGKCQITAEIQECEPEFEKYISPGIKGSLIVIVDFLEPDQYLLVPERAIHSRHYLGQTFYTIYLGYEDKEDKLNIAQLLDSNDASRYTGVYPCKVIDSQILGYRIINAPAFLSYTQNKRKNLYALLSSPPAKITSELLVFDEDIHQKTGLEKKLTEDVKKMNNKIKVNTKKHSNKEQE